MSFHCRQKKKCPVKPQISFNKRNLIYTAETKFLGVCIKETLKWNTHVQSLANKLSEVCFMIMSPKEIMSPHMLCNIYFSKFQSLFQFGILFGGRIIQLKKYLEYKNE